MVWGLMYIKVRYVFRYSMLVCTVGAIECEVSEHDERHNSTTGSRGVRPVGVLMHSSSEISPRNSSDSIIVRKRKKD